MNPRTVFEYDPPERQKRKSTAPEGYIFSLENAPESSLNMMPQNDKKDIDSPWRLQVSFNDPLEWLLNDPPEWI